jgi:hypothetical protein
MPRVWVIFLLCLPAVPRQVNAMTTIEVLQFEGVAPAGGEFGLQHEATFQEGHFTITAFTPRWIDGDSPVGPLVLPKNGTDWFLKGDTRGMYIEHTNAKPFFIRGFDVADFSFIVAGESPVSLTGVRTDDTTLTHVFHTPARAILTPPFFGTITTSEITGPLKRLYVGVDDNGYALDNIRLEVVPEPSTAWIGTVAFAPLIARGKRIKGRVSLKCFTGNETFQAIG